MPGRQAAMTVEDDVERALQVFRQGLECNPAPPPAPIGETGKGRGPNARGDDCPEHFGDGDRRLSDTTGGAVDEDRLSRLELTAVHQRAPAVTPTCRSKVAFEQMPFLHQYCRDREKVRLSLSSGERIVAVQSVGEHNTNRTRTNCTPRTLKPPAYSQCLLAQPPAHLRRGT